MLRLTKSQLARQRGHTFEEAVELYRQKLHSEGKLRKDTENRLVLLGKRWNKEELINITPLAWTQWQYKRWAGMKPGTMARNQGVMMAVLREAVEMGWLVGVPKLRKPKGAFKDARDVHLERHEIVPVVEHVRSTLGAMPGFVVLMLIDTGMRFGEMMNLKWRDFGPEWVTVRKGRYAWTKTLGRRVPMSPRLAEYVRKHKIPVGAGDEEIVPGLWSERPWTIGKKLNDALREACVALGCQCGADIRVHDMRHTFAFLLAQAGADIADIKDLMGHTNINMTMRYRGFIKNRATDTIKKAMAVVLGGANQVGSRRDSEEDNAKCGGGDHGPATGQRCASVVDEAGAISG